MTALEIVGLVISFISTGGLITVLTLGSTRKKAEGQASQEIAQADVVEEEANSKKIDNMAKLFDLIEKQTIKLNQKDEKAEQLSTQVSELSQQVCALTKEVSMLRKQTKRMIELIDVITPDNLEEIKLKIKKLHEESN